MGNESLPSSNDGPAKQAIFDFISSAVDPGSSTYIPASDRVAAFDNDGTMWVEQPIPVQLDFLFRTWVKEAQDNPSLASQQPYKAIIEQDQSFFSAVGEQQPDAVRSILEATGKSWEGTSPDGYDADVREYLASTPNEKLGVPHTNLIYRPMLELFDFLKENDYRIFICSGGGRDFMRVIAEDSWGVRKENVIGSAPEFEYKDGKLLRKATVLGNLSLGPGKPEHIFARTGRMATFAAGNADVDIEMLEAAQFALLIVHDDDDREFSYTKGSDRAVAAGKKNGWTFVSIKDDWKTVYVEPRGEESKSGN